MIKTLVFADMSESYRTDYIQINLDDQTSQSKTDWEDDLKYGAASDWNKAEPITKDSLVKLLMGKTDFVLVSVE